MSNLFQRLELQAFRAGITPRTKESREWFRKKASNLRSINREDLMKEEPLKTGARQIIGSMQMFFYDPKTKDTLPYYDKFPLAIIVGPAKGGFYGLNIHYLPPVLRAKFLDALMDIAGKKITDNSKFDLTYKTLKNASKMKYFEPCFKHYLTEHVKSKFAKVPAPEWEIATFLPTASWSKASSQKVFSDSRKMIGN
ncbi:MAG: hypothetical protein CMF43_02760 [Legionellales bacterium]|mgnify:FL=1|nr:hypothetical protein [Legionellales bacterium]